jgi:hypothetical protein
MIKGIVAATAVSVAMMATGAFAEIELKIATDSGDRDSPSGMAIANWASAIEEWFERRNHSQGVLSKRTRRLTGNIRSLRRGRS